MSVHGLIKNFGPVRAVDGVSLDIYPKEIIGIIGDNGAGKSTFLSLLVGFYEADEGEIIYKGNPIKITSPKTARNELQIEMVYQNLEIAPDLTVWENLFLGEELKLLGLFSDRRKMINRSKEVLQQLNTKISPRSIVGQLSGGEKQTVAIGRAILFERDIVIMDEPTAAISVQKVENVLKLIRKLKSYGKTVLLVSHRLEDVLEVSDRIVVFYHGKIRRVMQNYGLNVSDLVHAMF